MTILSLKQRIMWRVYTLWAARAALSRTALKVYILLVILWRSTAYVSYADVLRNHPGFATPMREALYIENAFATTETSTVVLLLGFVIFAAWVAFDLLPWWKRKKGEGSTSPDSSERNG